MGDVPGNRNDESKTSISLVTPDAGNDSNSNGKPVGETGASQQPKTDNTTAKKKSDKESTGVGKSEDTSSESDCKLPKKLEDPGSIRKTQTNPTNIETSDSSNVERRTKVADIKPVAAGSSYDLEAGVGESTFGKNDQAVPVSKSELPDAETVRDKGKSKKLPKSSGARVKESPKRVSTLSASSSTDGKDVGCFSRLSPKRFYDLFKTKSPKFKASSSRSPVFYPIEEGKYFEILYHGRYLPTEYERVERIDYANMAEEKIIPTFLGSHPCYDVMPTSGKVVVFSCELLVKNAFSALVLNEIKAAPLWDAGIMDFVGMLTISDFINVLRYYYITKPEDMKDIENQSIATWRRMTGVPKNFVKINGLDSLALAAKLLIQDRIHRIPVFDEKRQCVLFVLTKKRLLQFLSQGLLEKFDKTNVKTPSFFKKTIRELKVGTFEDIAVVQPETKIIDALSIFVTRNVSALPVLNKDNILVDIFEKFDVFSLAKDQTYHNLEVTVDEVIGKPYARETAWICTMDETLHTVIKRFVERKIHRVVVIGGRRNVVGMISLSDVLKFLVVQPLILMESATVSDTILEGTEGAVGGTEVETEADPLVEADLSAGVAHMKIDSSDTIGDTPLDKEEPSADD